MVALHNGPSDGAVGDGDLRVFKNKPFARFARKARLSGTALCEPIANAERGLVDADLCGGVIKVCFFTLTVLQLRLK